MFEGIGTLVLFSISMFVGSYLAGLVPLAFKLNETGIRFISIFGAGLLIGTALSVIIPEGIEALYEEKEESMGLKNKLPVDKLTVDMIESVKRVFPDAKKITKREVFHQEIDMNENRMCPEHEHKHKTHAIGLSLVIGFVFMLLVDQVTHIASKMTASTGRQKITATVGLVIHAAADGIALGSASSLNKNGIQFIVFFAIMLHKAPAAFSLVSFLLMSNLEKFKIKKHLLIFSLAAPVTALLTFEFLAVFGSENLDSSDTTGILMLFSAGTFLYVATVHVLPELQSTAKGNGELVIISSSSPGHAHSDSGPKYSGKELIVLITGAILPSLLSSGHSH
uniref:Zinc transporter ZIP9 n=1 Tax=Rhabditophanes sp. KR3021 TaxID=114890 RepID=A0AC35U1W8_9BILA